MAPYSARSHELLVHTCQTLAGDLDFCPSFDAGGLAIVTALLPDTATAAERVAIRTLMSTTLAHVIARTGIGRYPQVASAFFRWSSSNPTGDRWRTDIARLTETLAPFLSDRDADTAPSGCDVRVARALAAIDGGYRDPNLRLDAVAAESALSPSRLVRLLQAHTGAGFSANVHRRRLAEAQRLLTTTKMSVKEIAIAVGYGSSTQFVRRFVRQYGRTPVAFRRREQTAGCPS